VGLGKWSREWLDTGGANDLDKALTIERTSEIFQTTWMNLDAENYIKLPCSRLPLYS
jgi:hypothetical protein